ESIFKIEANPTASQVVRLRDGPVAENRSRIADRHDVIAPVADNLLDAGDHTFGNHPGPGIKLARLIFAAGENFYVSANHIDYHHTHRHQRPPLLNWLS